MMIREDCIHRQALLNMYECLDEDSRVYAGQVVRDIKALPSVIPTPKWIPCSEKLPKENECVGNVCKYYLVQDEYGDMHVAHYTNIGWAPIDSLKALENEVVAWMPKPKPYGANMEG